MFVQEYYDATSLGSLLVVSLAEPNLFGIEALVDCESEKYYLLDRVVRKID